MMKFERLIKPLMAICVALLAWISDADAVVLGNVEPVPGGPFITDGGISVVLSSNAITIAGGPTGVASGGSIPVPVTGLLTTGSLQVVGTTIDSGSFTTIDVLGGGSLFLSGSLLDSGFDVGVLNMLFSVAGGTAASDFGSLVLFSVASPTLGPDTLNNLPPPPNVDVLPATALISSAQLVDLPVPAALGLFLPGVGFIVLLDSLRRPERWSRSHKRRLTVILQKS